MTKPARDPFGHTSDQTLADGADAQRTHHDQIILMLVNIIDQHFEVLPFQRSPDQRHIGALTFFTHDIEIGIGNQLKAAGNQRIMDLPLLLQLLFVVVFFRKPRLHLLKALIMHFGGVDMAADHGRTERLCQLDPDIDGHVGIVGVINWNVDLLVHAGVLSTDMIGLDLRNPTDLMRGVRHTFFPLRHASPKT